MIPSTALTNAAAQESNSGSPSIPVAAPTEPSPVGKLDAVSDNRFFNIPAIACRELMPWEISRQALPAKQAWFELIGRLRFRSDIAGGVILVPDAYQSNNKVVLGLELGEVNDVESGYRALHLNRGSAGSTRKVRLVIHRCFGWAVG